MGGRGGAPRTNLDTAIAQAAARAQAPAAPPGDQLQADILRTYEGLRAQFDNEWVILTELRQRLGGTQGEQDAALLQLVKDRKIRLIPEENQQTLSRADRAASIRVSGEDKHLIGVPR